MKKSSKIMLVVMLLVVLALGAYAIFKPNDSKDTSTTAKQSGKITIIASTNVYSEIADKVAGKYGQVSAVITKQSVSPEDYEPTAKVANEVSQADIALANGLGYDSWMNKLAKASSSTQLIQVGSDVVKSDDKANPHLWNNPDYMAQTAYYLADQLAKKDPKHKDYYQDNAKQYEQSLQPVRDMMNRIREESQGAQVAQTETVYQYMLQNLGYNIADEGFAEAIAEGNDPSPAVLSQLQNDIKDHKLKFLVQNTQTTGSTVDHLVKLAKQNDTPIIKVTETIPNHTSYVDWKLSELKQIKALY
ncbi:metal ABC transporter solute-binding protein, Zn/Mn family [Eupransor demetentiae]|uniref:Zn-binding component ZnuA (ZnuA) n=1 Tax=Eupransor demetentiae TaxID=3109584 RepID=A0ABM9N6M5_9LACO|nr:ABC-type Zn uptake system ZnuABC [Lactobacillaceae bacterium LMG 33000]